MSFAENIANRRVMLMEGALGERLKREYGLVTNGVAGMAGLVETEEGRNALRALWGEYIQVARKYGLPFMATTPTRRANQDRVPKAGLTDRIFEDNIQFLLELKAQSGVEMYAGGMMGSVGNAYTAEGCLPFSKDVADFHRWEAERFAATGADFLFAGLIPTLPEAIGIAVAMSDTPLPYVISLTIQGDGCLIDGTPIDRAIEEVDAAVDRRAECFMTNCVHPSIVLKALDQPFNQTARVRERFLGLQANTSALPYCELDQSPVLYTSAPEELAAGMLKLYQANGFCIFGGCCGTDARHLDAMARAILNG
ncbi:MAG TPA: homocysteine S-methyltransferase family protein [Candidatus Limiplasma sp.]|nr:homocysteine S-methyltransferase family protein [Candidatus Limiplasma sp.]HPS81160.1 homocysteine S-methyltransferase family protein [Candidatus Limiplasma sp.]